MCSLFFPKNISPEIFLIWSWTPSWVSAVVFGPNPERPLLFVSQKIPVIAIRLTELLAHLGIWVAEKAQLSRVQGGVEIGGQIPETGIRSLSISDEYRKPLPRAVRSRSGMDKLSTPEQSSTKHCFLLYSCAHTALNNFWAQDSCCCYQTDNNKKTLRKGKEKDDSFKRS